MRPFSLLKYSENGTLFSSLQGEIADVKISRGGEGGYSAELPRGGLQDPDVLPGGAVVDEQHSVSAKKEKKRKNKK